MKNLRGTYVHRGDAQRRRTRVRQTVLAVSFFSASAFLLGNRKPVSTDAIAAPVPAKSSFRLNLSTDRSLASQLDSARGELDLAHMQLDRANKIIGYSTQYGIRADLATNILDVASAEGIDPELAFRLVKLESDFNPHATSHVGAIGLTQVMPATARYLREGHHRRGAVRPQHEPSRRLPLPARTREGVQGRREPRAARVQPRTGGGREGAGRG